MMRIENSPEFEARIEAFRREAEENRRLVDEEYRAAQAKWEASSRGWLPMEDCPFNALDDRYGFDGVIVVTNGKDRALASVRKRFGRPIFWKTEPEMVWRDGIITLIGGEEDPRTDLPAWYWEWELTDEYGQMNYAGGAETGKDEIRFYPTLWTFLPEPPVQTEP